MILLNLELFLLTLRREREEKADDSKRFELTEETAHLKSSRLIQVVHYMQEHVQEQIDMNTLCDVFYMSRSTLQHLFLTFFDYATVKLPIFAAVFFTTCQNEKSCYNEVVKAERFESILSSLYSY